VGQSTVRQWGNGAVRQWESDDAVGRLGSEAAGGTERDE
jgi:hypothetical protein